MDWDTESIPTIKARLSLIQKDFPNAVIQMRTSATKGYHVRIILSEAVDSFYYRRRWRDDGNRLVLDIMRGCDKKEPMQVLWDTKIRHYLKDGYEIKWAAGEWISH